MTKSTMSLAVLAAVLALTLGGGMGTGPAYGGYQGPETGLLVALEGRDVLSAAHLNSDEKEGESCNHD
ncbi:MAG: hypothetical protein IH904_09815 [Proteobacteria bacterium]|nr:hypothetical protein [Pseudomonadota bacterium]